MFELENVSIAYEDEPVLSDISIQICSGEKVVVIGQSGAGKSTLLKKLYDTQQQRAAFIHQDYALVPQLSVFHNVCIGRLDKYGTAYNLLNLVRPQQKALDEVVPLLEALGMPDKTHERVSNLSGGQQQRVAVARAIYRGGDAVLGDEPVSAIDPHQAGAVLRLLSAGFTAASLKGVKFMRLLFLSHTFSFQTRTQTRTRAQTRAQTRY